MMSFRDQKFRGNSTRYLQSKKFSNDFGANASFARQQTVGNFPEMHDLVDNF